MTRTVNPTNNPETRPPIEQPATAAPVTAAVRAAVFRLNHAHRAFLETTAGVHGLGTTDLDALLQLALDEPLTPGQLRIRMRLSTGAITALTDRLDAAGFLNRLQHPTDRRSLFLVLTLAGRDVVHEITGQYNGIIATIPMSLPTARYLTELAAAVLSVSSEAGQVRVA